MQAIGNIDGEELPVRHKIFTVSNLFSFSRMLVAFPVIYFHYKAGMKPTWVVNAFIIYGIISDYLDGYFARKMNEISELGKVLDPFADKVAAFILFLYIVVIGQVPWLFFIFMVIRDASITTGSLYIRKKRGKVPMSIMSGKITLNVIVLYWLSVFYLPQYHQTHIILMWVAVVFMVYSFGDYINRFNRILKGANFN